MKTYTKFLDESAYDKANSRFKKSSGRTLEDAGKEYEKIAQDTAKRKKEYEDAGIISKPSVKEDHIPIAMGKMLDSEGAMIKNQLETIERSVKLLREQIKDDDMQVPAWVQAKVTLATENILTCANYMAGKDEEVSEEVEQIDELKKTTLASYIKKAHVSGLGAAAEQEKQYQYGKNKSLSKFKSAGKKGEKREAGISLAADKLTREKK
jgi:hypothetical protein